MNLIRKFLSLPAQDSWYLFQALIISIFAKLVITLFPLRWYSRYLIWRGNENSIKQTVNSELIIQRVITAVNRCSRYAPWTTRCLVDAVTAKLMLQKHKIRTTLFLGVTKEGNQKLIAHAWLKCGDRFITGRKGHQRFTVVSSFT